MDANISFRTLLGGTIFMWYIWWRGRGIKDITLAESKTLQTQPPNSCLTHSVGSGMVPTSHRILLNTEAKSSLCLLYVKQSEVTMVEIAASPLEGLRALPTSPELSCPWFHPETSNVKDKYEATEGFPGIADSPYFALRLAWPWSPPPMPWCQPWSSHATCQSNRTAAVISL